MLIKWNNRVAPGILWLAAALCCCAPAQSQTTLPCGPFTPDQIAAPEPREAKWPLHRFAVIKAELASVRHRVLFLGDSLTEWFEAKAPEVWRREMAPREVLDAGVSGDRTEHLLWRLQHGNLAGPPPAGVVVLIGTNDLTAGRLPELVAEGVRANLDYLRRQLPATPILVLGLWPREALPEAPLRQATLAVNRLIERCGDNRVITYAELGGAVLDRDRRLTPEMSPDMLHLTPAGYALIAPKLGNLIDHLAPRR